jgi:tRNA (guanine37-N1)-methyltransferase
VNRQPLQFHFITLFPEVFGPALASSLLGKAVQNGRVAFQVHALRSFSEDKHRTVDDTPYGGGEGMLLKADVLDRAWQQATRSEVAKPQDPTPRRLTILTSPQGKLLTQELARELATYDELVVISGHYEGVDERFIDRRVDLEVSIGDYVLTGGELPALVMADCVTRLLPGVVGNDRSVTEDSLEGGLLKYPQYTRPRDWEGQAVPEILLSGDHGKIAQWRQAQRLERTRQKRPDLFAAYEKSLVRPKP